MVRVGDNTSIIGKTGSCKGLFFLLAIIFVSDIFGEYKALVGVGLRVLDATNVIIRNVKISKVLASSGDALAIQNSKQVWVDHVDLSSDKNNGKVIILLGIYQQRIENDLTHTLSHCRICELPSPWCAICNALTYTPNTQLRRPP